MPGNDGDADDDDDTNARPLKHAVHASLPAGSAAESLRAIQKGAGRRPGAEAATAPQAARAERPHSSATRIVKAQCDMVTEKRRGTTVVSEQEENGCMCRPLPMRCHDGRAAGLVSRPVYAA